MLAYRYPLIAREGWLWIGVALCLAASTQALVSWLALPLWLLVLLLLLIFRDPPRQVPAMPLAIVSPVDGVVTRIATLHDGYLQREALCISIRMRVTDIYSLRSPMEGRIQQQWLEESPKLPDAGARRKQRRAFAQWIQSDEADDVVLVVESGVLGSMPRCYAQQGQRIGQGQRCGYIRLGAPVHVLLPAGTRIDVAVGDEVRSGADILATLVHAAATAPRRP